LYADYRGEAYTLLRDLYEPGYRIRNDGLQQGSTYLSEVETFLHPLLPSNPKVLDWGGDTGVNTPFKAPGNCIHVFDISEVSPLPGIARVNFEEALTQRYDLVACSNVLEHTPNPAATLAQISQVMNENAVLYLEVPHEVLMRSYATGAERLRAKRHWHEHVNFYTDTALQSLVRMAGLSIIKFEEKKIVSGSLEFHQFFVACKLSGPRC